MCLWLLLQLIYFPFSKQWRSHFLEIQMAELLPRKNFQLIESIFLEISILLQQSVNNLCSCYLTLLKTHRGTLLSCVPTLRLCTMIAHFPQLSFTEEHCMLCCAVWSTVRCPRTAGSELLWSCFPLLLFWGWQCYLLLVLWRHVIGKENKSQMMIRKNQYSGHVQQYA